MYYFNRWDILAAYHLFSVHYNGDRYTNGIGCRLSRLKYRPTHSEEYMSGLSDNGKAIYAALVRRHYAINVAYDRMIKRANGRLSDREIRLFVGLPVICDANCGYETKNSHGTCFFCAA